MKNGIANLVTKSVVIIASFSCLNLSAFAAEGDGEEESNIGLDIGYASNKQNYTLGLEYGFTQFGEGDASEDVHNVLIKPGYAFGGDTMIINGAVKYWY